MMRRTALAVAALLLASSSALAAGAYVTRTVQDGSGTHLQSYYDESGVGTGPFDPVYQMPSGFSGSSSGSGGAVYGPDAAGNAPSKPPVLFGALDGSGNVRAASPNNPLFVQVLQGNMNAQVGYTNAARESVGSGIYTYLGLDSSRQVRTSESGSPDPGVGITPAQTTTAGTSQIGKASAGNLYSAYATAPTAPTAQQYLVVVNATAAPASGATIAPLDWAPFNSATAAGATASINYGSGPPDAYSTGIVALVSTSLTTYTPGTASMINVRVR